MDRRLETYLREEIPGYGEILDLVSGPAITTKAQCKSVGCELPEKHGGLCEECLDDSLKQLEELEESSECYMVKCKKPAEYCEDCYSEKLSSCEECDKDYNTGGVCWNCHDDLKAKAEELNGTILLLNDALNEAGIDPQDA